MHFVNGKNSLSWAYIWVAQIVKPDARQAGTFEQSLHVIVGAAGTDRTFWPQRVGEDPLGTGAFPPFLQRLGRAGRQGDGTPILSRLGLAGGQPAALVLMESPAHCQRPLLPVEVGPHQPADLTPPHPAVLAQVHIPVLLDALVQLFHQGLLTLGGDIPEGRKPRTKFSRAVML